MRREVRHDGYHQEDIGSDIHVRNIRSNHLYTNSTNIWKTMSKNVIMMNLESNQLQLWTIREVLSEINRDRSEHWTDYDDSDWKDGWMEWCEGDSYSLICEVGDKVIINNIFGDHVGYNGEEVEVKGCVDTGYLIVGDGWWCSLGEVAFVMEGGDS